MSNNDLALPPLGLTPTALVFENLNPPLLQETVLHPTHAERMDYIVFLQNGK